MCRVMSFVMNTQRETVTAGIGIRLAAEAERLGKLARQPVSPVFRKNTPDTEVPGKFTLGDQCDRLPDFTDRDLSARTGVRAGITAPAQADRPLDRGLVLAISVNIQRAPVWESVAASNETLTAEPGCNCLDRPHRATSRGGHFVILGTILSQPDNALGFCFGYCGMVIETIAVLATLYGVDRVSNTEKLATQLQDLNPEGILDIYLPLRPQRHFESVGRNDAVLRAGQYESNGELRFTQNARSTRTSHRASVQAEAHSPTPSAFGKQDVAGFLALGHDYGRWHLSLQRIAEKSNVARLKVVGPTRTNRHPVPLATDDHPVCWAKIGVAVSYLRSIDSAHIHDFSTQKEVNPPEAFGTWTQPYTGVIG